MTAMEWQDRARCAGNPNPEQWFIEPRTATKTDPHAAARAICDQCPVKAQCLTFAIDNELNHGMFGGLTGKERNSLRQGQPAARRVVNQHTSGRAEEHAARMVMWENGATDGEIADARNCTARAIRSWRRHHALGSNEPPPQANYTHARYRALWEEGLCDREIAEREGVTREVVNGWRARAGLPCNADPTGQNYIRDLQRRTA